MRPESHRDEYIPQSCGNCKFAVSVRYDSYLLCFYGEMDLVGIEEYDIFFKDEPLSIMDGEEFSDNIWALRVVDGITGTCDNWQQES